MLDALNEALGPHIFPDKGDGTNPRACPTCGTGLLSLKTGKFGAFIGCSNYPECRFTRQLATSEGDGEAEAADRELGINPATGRAVWLKNGRFGPYVEELAAADSGDKPKRSSLPKGWVAAAIDLEKALRLLSPAPRGRRPPRGRQDHHRRAWGASGRSCCTTAPTPTWRTSEDVFDIGLNRAVALLADKRAGGGRPQRGQAAALTELGNHPEDGKPIRVLSGRFGPYIKHGDTNANVPKGS